MATPPVFSSGQILTAAHMNAVGLWRVTTVTGGNGTNSLNVPSAFSADFSNYRVFITGGTIAVGTTIRMRLGAAATNYNAGYLNMNYAAAGGLFGNDNAATYWTQVGYASPNGSTGNIELIGPQQSVRTSFSTSFAILGASGYVTGGGYHNTVAQYTDFTLSTTSAANWTSDLTVEVFGYN